MGAGAKLVANRLEVRVGRSDEEEAVLARGTRQAHVLGQKAVSRMNGVGFGPDRRADNRLDVEITAARLRRPDADRAVGEPCWHGVEVRLRSREHCLDAEVAAGADDADGDLAAVRDQDPPDDHVGGWRNRIRTCSASTSWPSEA
jgi:hypothetical protein